MDAAGQAHSCHNMYTGDMLRFAAYYYPGFT